MLDTQRIMQTALRLAHFKTIPADSGIHVRGRKIRKVLVSIDVSTAELLLAKELGCDAVIAHHPAGGTAQLYGYEVFLRHIGQMRAAGVPADVAKEAVKNKYRVLDIQHHPENYDQTTNVAKRLGLPLLTIHSPCDEVGRRMLVEATKNIGENATVNKLVSTINAFPEYRNAETKIQVRLGSPKNRIGKLAISHAVYTNGGFDVAKAYYEHGIDTLCYIHISEPDLTKLASLKLGRNLIILGHIASDWLGINRLLRELEKNDVESVPTTELTFSRK
ncbi:Nif3-like dinuclear metal center hexameric protein [Candidatus Bathyarchaeota archaeon]|nr:Nif3-like dinuclear metal center hexameric protein [Candidatus Bathyarchaeota archaeon]